MASPIQTQGFSVGERLNPQYVSGAALVPRYDSVIPALSQGLGAAQQFSQIVDDAQARPLRRQLQQIQLQEAQDRMAIAPLVNARRRAELSMPIEISNGRGIEEVPRHLQPMLDLDGTPILDASGNPRMENVAGDMDVFEAESFVQIDPITGARKTVSRRGRPISTLEQQRIQDRLELREVSLAESRALKASLAAEIARNPDWKKGDRGVDSQGNLVTLYYNTKTGEQKAIPTDLVPITSVPETVQVLRELGVTGGDAPKATPRAKPMFSLDAAPREVVAEIPADVAADIDALSGVAPKAPTVADKFTAGKIYTDASGNRAEYLGNGQWREIR